MDAEIGILSVILAIAGLIIAWSTYQKTFKKKNKEAIEHLSTQFRMTQTLNLKLRENIQHLMLGDNYESGSLWNMKYSECLNYLEFSYNKYLSEGLLTDILNNNLTEYNIKSMSDSLEVQFNALLRLNTEVELKLYPSTPHAAYPFK